jgi:hypothetical protein
MSNNSFSKTVGENLASRLRSYVKIRIRLYSGSNNTLAELTGTYLYNAPSLLANDKITEIVTL